MAALIPSKQAVERTLAAIESASVPTDDELGALLKSPSLDTGLDHWALWTLVCLCRHVRRQKWVGYIVETKLKGDLSLLGRAGAMGHPEEIPQSGAVPDEPGWSYYFHGRGCCLTHQKDGVSIDVDFDDQGSTERIDRFFYSTFLEELKHPELPEQQLRRKAPLQHAWQANISVLVSAGCLETGRGLPITHLGQGLFSSLEPLVESMDALLTSDTVSANRRLLFAALSLGEVVLARQFCKQGELDPALAAEIDKAAEQLMRQRAAQFTGALQKTADNPDSCLLAALADLGIKFSKTAVTQCLFREPIDGVANTALAVLIDWNEPDLATTLEQLVGRRYEQAFGIRSRVSRFLGSDAGKDKLPRSYQLVHAITGYLNVVPPTLVKLELRDKLISLLEESSGANSGEAALLLYALSAARGLNRLRVALSGSVPAAHTDSAAACVLIGTAAAQQVLVDALVNPNLQIQHNAACALERFPSAEARELATRWQARLDGIDSPAGKEVAIEGRSITTYTFDDVSHANMSLFLTSALDRLRRDCGQILSRARSA